MNNPIKATRAEIRLGEIPLEVFMLPSGKYQLSQTQSAEAVDKSELSFRQFRASKSPEALPYKDFKAVRWSVEGSIGKANLIPIDLAVAYWTKEAITGNAKAARLLGACAAESIERRADAAFRVQRTEEERQAKMQARIEGKETRRQLMDAIADYLNRHSELSDNRRRFMFINVSQQVDKQVFGRIATKLAEDLGVSKSQVRDALTPYELLLLREVEDSAMRRIDLLDIDPVEAVRQSAQALLIPVQTRSC